MSTKSDMGEIIDRHTIEAADDMTGIIICACGETGPVEDHPWHVAGCLRAEGWTKTRRIITTAEDLQLLHAGAVIIDSELVAWQWSGLRFTAVHPASSLTPSEFFRFREGAATVLYEPTP